MNDDQDNKFYFDLRKEGKVYVSKAFTFPFKNEEVRNLHIVFEHSDLVVAGEINGALSLRQTHNEKQQVLVLLTQDDKKIKRITLQKFKERKSGDYSADASDSFSFRGDELKRLVRFLESTQFIDLINKDRFQIEDLSSGIGNRTIIDSAEKEILAILGTSVGVERIDLLKRIRGNLSNEDIKILLRRKEALDVFENHLVNKDWTEPDWQAFFQEQNWIFGYGLDYRIMTQFDRELNVSSVGTDNKEKAIVDFLMSFTDFTVTVEVKKPETPIFEKIKGGRSGIWNFHHDFIEAISQVLEQKTEWHILGQRNNLYNKDGKKLSKRTRDAKAILVIGHKSEFLALDNEREKEIKQDTFELFRRDSRNIEIITYDELFERARFIVNK